MLTTATLGPLMTAPFGVNPSESLSRTDQTAERERERQIIEEAVKFCAVDCSALLSRDSAQNKRKK